MSMFSHEDGRDNVVFVCLFFSLHWFVGFDE